jgi:hypothetical protein
MPTGLELLAGQYEAQDQNWASMFVKSMMGSAGELIGQEPGRDVSAWNETHPGAHLAASLVPNIGYFGGALKLGRIGLLGKYGTAVDNLGAGWNPILRYGTQEALRLAPFEASRMAITAASGGDTDSVAADIVLNAGLSAGLGAGFGIFEAAGRPLLKKWGQLYDGSRLSPLQLQSRDLRSRISKFDPEQQQEALRQLEDWRVKIVGEEAPKEGVLSRSLENGGNTKELNRLLFDTTGKKGTGQHLVRKPVGGVEKRGEFGNKNELRNIQSQLELADDWHDFVQHPRFINPRTVDAKKNLEASLNRNMGRVGSDSWIAKESDGLYVGVKRSKDQENYFAFKTDDPKRFLDDGGMLKKIEDQSAWFRQPSVEEASLINSVEMLKDAKQFRDAVPLAVVKEAPARGAGKYLETSAKSMAEFLGYNPEFGGAKKVIGDFLNRYVAPATYQFKNPEARYSMSAANMLFAKGHGIVTERMVGAQELSKDGFLKKAASGGEVTGGIVPLIQKLNDEDLSFVTKVLRQGDGIEEATAAGASKEVLEMLEFAKKIDDVDMPQIEALQKLTGETVTRRKQHHFGLQRTYDGDHFIEIKEGKRTVGIAGGKTVGAAQKEARRIVAAAERQGRSWFADETKMVSRGDRAEQVLFNRLSNDATDRMIVAEGRGFRDDPMTPGRLSHNRSKTIEVGFRGSETPLTKQQLIDGFNRTWTQSQRYISQLSWAHTFKDINTKVAGMEPQVWNQMQQRINDHIGVKNAGDKMINAIVDPYLGKIIGTNSASKLARGLNSIQFNLNFGAGNLAFPMMQLAQFTQTVAPEIAFLQHASFGRKSQYYTSWAVGGPDMKPRTTVGMLDTFKMMGRGFKIMGNPSRALGAEADEYVMFMNAAMKRGTLSPGMIDEFIGDAARQKLSALEKLKDTGNLWHTFSRLNMFLPQSAERLSRLHAATVAYDFGKNVMGFADRNLENFIDEFTKRTMFGYSIADRPRIFTGPIGSAFGLFKNWQLNYLHMLSDYLGEGFGQNNWKPLLWSFVGSSAIGGVGAGGAMYGVADGMSQLLGNDSLMTTWYDNFQRDPEKGNWSDAMFLGLPAFLPTLVGLPGVSFTSQAALPGSDPSRDISQLLNFVYWDRMKAVGQFGDALAGARGNIFTNEEVQGSFLRAFAPKTIYRLQQTLSEGVINSSSSLNPTQSGLSRTEQVLYALGFNPNNIELGFRAGDELWKDQEKNLLVTQSLGNSWADAELRGDWDGLDKIMKRAMLEGIDMDRVWRSANSRIEQTKGDMFQKFDPTKVARYQQSGVLR